MPDTPEDIKTRLNDARRLAESKLTSAISSIKDTDDYKPYLPAITSFADALFDAEARELIFLCNDEASFEKELQSEVAPRIIEGILPDRGLQKITDVRTDELRQLKTQVDLDTNLLEELGCNGTYELARRETQAPYAPHGAWEYFMPKRVRLALRLSEGPTVRNALRQALQRRSIYWAGQFFAQMSSFLRVNTRRKQGPGAPNALLNKDGDLGIQAHEFAGNLPGGGPISGGRFSELQGCFRTVR